MRKNISKTQMVFGLVFLVLSVSLVSAFGPISGYNEDNPLQVHAGEEKQITYGIYPTPEEGSLKVKAEIISGSEIASITDSSDIYDAAPGDEGTVNIEVLVPSGTSVGTEYIVQLRFTDETPKEDVGSVGLTLQSDASFKVVVIEKPQETPAGEGISLTWWILGIVVVIVIILIIWFLMKSKKEAPVKPIK